MNSHKSKSEARGAGSTSHTGVTMKNLYPHVAITNASGQKTNYSAASSLVLHQHQTDTVFNCSTSVSGILSSAGFADIVCRGGSLNGVFKGATLEMIIANNSAAAVISAQNATIGPAQALIERVEILVGSQLVSRHEGYAHLFINDYRHTDQHSATLLRAACDVGANIPATSSTTVYVPLLHLGFQNHFLGHFGDITFRVWFRGPSAWQTAATVPTLSSLNLYVQQDALDKAEYQALMDRGRSTVLDIRYQRPGYNSFVDSLVANGRTSYQLSGVHGLVTSMSISIRLASATGSALTVFQAPARIEVLSSDGSSIIGGTSLPEEYVRLVKAASNSSNSFLEAGILFLDFAASTRATLEHGSLGGYMPFSGSEQLVITMPAGLASASYEVSVHFYAACRLRTIGMQCEVLPS